MCPAQFKLHKNANDEEVVANFLARWREYAVMMRTNEGSPSGLSLGQDQLAALSEDQRRQLDRLRTTLFEEGKE